MKKMTEVEEFLKYDLWELHAAERHAGNLEIELEGKIKLLKDDVLDARDRVDILRKNMREKKNKYIALINDKSLSDEDFKRAKDALKQTPRGF